MIVYGLLKFEQLFYRQNPNITAINKENHIDASDVLNLSESGLRIAFEVTSLDGNVGKYDPRYVKYIFRMWNAEI